jgi:hypothetical protein
LKLVIDKLSTPEGKTEAEKDKEYEFDLCIQDSFVVQRKTQ